MYNNIVAYDVINNFIITSTFTASWSGNTKDNHLKHCELIIQRPPWLTPASFTSQPVTQRSTRPGRADAEDLPAHSPQIIGREPSNQSILQLWASAASSTLIPVCFPSTVRVYWHEWFFLQLNKQTEKSSSELKNWSDEINRPGVFMKFAGSILGCLMLNDPTGW